MPSSRLSELFSKAKDAEAEAEGKHDRSKDRPVPPPYTPNVPADFDADNAVPPPDITAGFKNLDLSGSGNTTNIATRSIAHLKVIECFYRLKQRIGSSNGLFGINDSLITKHVQSAGIQGTSKEVELLAKLAEKRWAIYVTRAVDRFQQWYKQLVPETRLNLNDYVKASVLGHVCDPAHGPSPLIMTPSNLPSVDVLMVWHAYMLNPRAYLEDQIRYGKMQLWHTDFPWTSIDQCIDLETFEYKPPAAASELFTNLTGEPWLNEHGSDHKRITCMKCKASIKSPWSTCDREQRTPSTNTSASALASWIDRRLINGHGYCDQQFDAECTACGHKNTHATLQAAKFFEDLNHLLSEGRPMAGTVLGFMGIPPKVQCSRERRSTASRLDKYTDRSALQILEFPNKLLSGRLGREILAVPTQSSKQVGVVSVDAIKKMIESALEQRSYTREASSSRRGTLERVEKISVRKLMARYWDNDSPFALDLVGAVIRQGTFIEKMHHIDWLHSPALPNTMRRVLQKYERFMGIMADRSHMAVPTLDVDLAWHTHQLQPFDYLAYTLSVTRQFIDHDDKVAETKLNDSFAWTSKQYEKTYGEPYSECTCWYCEAIRERTQPTVSRLFGGGGRERARTMLTHDPERNPARSVHISAHNAVRPTGDVDYDAQSGAASRALEAEYQKACERARKKGRKPPRRDDYYYSDAYGYPVYIPMYYPFGPVYGYSPAYYPGNPGCMSIGTNNPGNCCAGTCGGAVAAGGCAGGVGCAGGATASCGGAGCGGGGGGGGGGGCGGGGGGGGGGGCGGGGGGGC